jgi:hypothetical protein
VDRFCPTRKRQALPQKLETEKDEGKRKSVLALLAEEQQKQKDAGDLEIP